MDALLFAVALEVALLQLRIHGIVTPSRNVCVANNDNVSEGSTDLRLSCKPRDKGGKLQYEKLVRDRDQVKGVLRSTLGQVAGAGKWDVLEDAVDVLGKRILKAMSTRKEHDRLETIKTRIVHNLETKKQQWENKFWEAEHKIALLRDKKQDDLLNAKTRLRYAELWLAARAEAKQLEFQIQNKPAPIRSPEHENRIHEEICKAIKLQIQEREKSTEYWQVRYAKDTKDIYERLAKQRQQLQVVTAKREELQELYKLHEGEMRAWLSFKEQRAARLAREEMIRMCAIRIQAWWRGAMVRKALGPFKYLKNLKKSPTKGKKK